jgi:hypothetical protein
MPSEAVSVYKFHNPLARQWLSCQDQLDSNCAAAALEGMYEHEETRSHGGLPSPETNSCDAPVYRGGFHQIIGCSEIRHIRLVGNQVRNKNLDAQGNEIFMLSRWTRPS